MATAGATPQPTRWERTKQWARKIPPKDYWLYAYWTCFFGGIIYLAVEYYTTDPEERKKAMEPVVKPKPDPEVVRRTTMSFYVNPLAKWREISKSS